MERGEGRSSRQASPRPNAHRASQSIARPDYDHGADLRDEILGMLLCALLGMLLAWCVMCPDYQPISKAEWEAQLAGQGAYE